MSLAMSTLWLGLAVSSYLTFVFVDCEAAAVQRNVFTCAGPRFLAADTSVAAAVVFGVVLAGHALAAMLALFALASCAHLLRPRAKAKERGPGVTARRSFKVVQKPPVASAAVTSRPGTGASAAQPAAEAARTSDPRAVPVHVKRRLAACPPIVDQQGLQLFLAQEEADARRRARQ
eukprot:1915803-Prymnesium_polylepis.1